MKVYKFGGASVRNAEGVRNLRHIVEGEESLFIIVSAMGKTTNALERVFTHMQKAETEAANEEIKNIISVLLPFKYPIKLETLNFGGKLTYICI